MPADPIRGRWTPNAVHAIAQILCFQEHGDWRYDPGKPQHRNWRVKAEQILVHAWSNLAPAVDGQAIERAAHELFRLGQTMTHEQMIAAFEMADRYVARAVLAAALGQPED